MILGALLAAGTGTRFGEGNKLLADLDGEPVVARAARTLAESSIDACVAVVGHDREAVAEALPADVAVVANPDYDSGQSASVRRGVAVARERGADAVVFALGDLPCVRVETVDALIDAYRSEVTAARDETGTAPVEADAARDGAGTDRPGIVAPRHEGRRGNPVLFDARYFDALASVEGDAGGRALLDSEPVAWVDVDDPGVRLDVDTDRDLRALRNRQSGSSSDGESRSASDGEPGSTTD